MKTMKKILSLFIALIMTLSAMGISFISSASFDHYNAPVSDYPCVYVHGQGETIVTEDGEVAYEKGNPGNGFDLKTEIKECLPYLKDALLKGDWDTYREKLLTIADRVYGKARLDNNGDPQYGTHIANTWQNNQQYTNKTLGNGQYPFCGYDFIIDWRLDPFETAAVLNEYIENVMKSTGKDKVNLIARCAGCNIACAYLVDYGTESLNTLTLYVPTIMGSEPISGLFSGNMNFEGYSLDRFKDQKLNLEDELVAELLDSALALLNDTYATDGVLHIAKPLVNKLYDEVISPFILASYGTMPGIWAIVGNCDDDYYEQAKAKMFAGKEEEYAGLIAKIDRYDKEVRKPLKKLLKDVEAAGVPVAVWAKYGEYTMIPVCPDNTLISDGTASIYSATLGATQTHYGETFSDSYIAEAEKKGTAKYISADKVCDMSTALFPDTTWLLYNSEHSDFPADIHGLLAKFIASNGTMTVDSDPDVPQYISCTTYRGWGDVYFSPLTAENGMQPDTAEKHTIKSMTEKFVTFVKALFALLKNLIQEKINSSETAPTA